MKCVDLLVCTRLEINPDKLLKGHLQHTSIMPKRRRLTAMTVKLKPSHSASQKIIPFLLRPLYLHLQRSYLHLYQSKFSMFPNGLLRPIGSLLPTLCFLLWLNQDQVHHSENLAAIFTFQVLMTITTMLSMSLIINLLLNFANLLDLQTLRPLKPRKLDYYFSSL